ncbi:uncharacterized protein LOC113150984 [Anabas testudineus]|uniref:uncharacterized protein LOC113150984 n=1 Tax=Anabas testudineus TaxID=64144 RepID=UPI000E45E145|nr:uncharacterized protein LOC113150984 [Anabas testudineus]
MNELVTLFLLLLAPGLDWCFPVTAGGSSVLQVFYCKSSGCAFNVTQVFCNDELLFSETQIADCTGLPPPNTVCQHGGRAFVSIDTPGSCDFEGASYIKTTKCTNSTKACTFTNATTSSSNTTMNVQEPQKSPISPAVYVVLVLVLVPVVYFFKKRHNRDQNQQPDSDKSEPILKMQQARETTLSDTKGDQSRLENGSFPSQCDPET